MGIKKNIRLALLTFLIFCGLARGWYLLTDGFSVANIVSLHSSYNPRWEPKEVRIDQTALFNILSQKFIYLSKGSQSYVFLSEDGKFVLKFFKYNRLRPSQLEKLFFFIPSITRYYQECNQEKLRMIDLSFESCILAHDELFDQTGVLYTHLNKGVGLNQKTTFFDKIGRTFELDLDQYEFYIQSWADPLEHRLNLLLTENKQREAEELIDSLLVKVKGDFNRGYLDQDPALLQNSGVFMGKVISIDVGQFQKTAALKEEDFYRKEFEHRLFILQRDLQKKYPLLSNYVQKEGYHLTQ